ncbi:hypothetical protein [Paenibacillus tyrfis]|nr:hypothetical protein [Paenibacillus tyrfis]
MTWYRWGRRGKLASADDQALATRRIAKSGWQGSWADAQDFHQN